MGYLNGMKIATTNDLLEIPVPMDYIVEQGTEAMGSNGIWYWTKWASGRAECYGVKNFGQIDIATAWGSLYVSNSEYTQDFPTGLFNAAPYVSITPYGTTDGTFLIHLKGYGSMPTATRTGYFDFYRPSTYSVQSSYVGFHAIGTWK